MKAFPPMRIFFVFLLIAAPMVSRAGGQSLYKSVAEFGADGKDGKDDTQAIKAAIAATGSNGGVVFLPAGKYVISEPLVIDKSGVTLMGEGRGSVSEASGSLLMLSSATTSTAVIISNCQYSGIRNLMIAPKKAADNPAGQGKDAAIKMADTYHGFAKEILIYSMSSGIEILNGISPVLEDIDLKNLSGDFGIWIHGSGGSGEDYEKVDAATFARLSGATNGKQAIEWMIVGPNVDGCDIRYARFVSGSHALVLRNDETGKRPKYVYTDHFGSDHAFNEAVLIEAGNDVVMSNTWIGQNRQGDGLVIGPNFTGPAEFNNLRIRGSWGSGMRIMGGQNIYISNPLIGACCSDPALKSGGSGILIEAGVKHLRITGGGVCPLPETGPRSKQYYGIRYLGTSQQAIENSVRISGVDTVGNPVPFEPASLPLDKEE